MPRLYSNRAQTTLASSINNVTNTITVANGAVFPTPVNNDFAILTIQSGALFERVRLTARAGNVLTVVRGADGTTAQSFTAPTSTVSLNPTASSFEDIPYYGNPEGKTGVFAGGDIVGVTTGLNITIGAGTGILNGKYLSWAQQTVTTPNANSMVFINGSGVLAARSIAGGETLPIPAEIPVYRTFVTAGAISAIIPAHTYVRQGPRGYLDPYAFVRACVVPSGPYAGAVAQTPGANINWYFSNMGLYPFCEELPSIVQAHLDVQNTAIWSSATGTGSTNWTTLHGTTWNNYFNWPFDVNTPTGTPALVRADSHGAYAGAYARLAVRFARKAPNGLAWWDANVGSVQNALFQNVYLRQRLAAGYATETFQDPTVYPFCQTMDNTEIYRGYTEAVALMTERGGAQAAWAALYGGAATNVRSALQGFWSNTANINGETGWLSVRWNNSANAIDTNNHAYFYPDIQVYAHLFAMDVPLHTDYNTNRDRLERSFNWMLSKTPWAWTNGRSYDVFPWGFGAAAAAKAGRYDLALDWIKSFELNFLYNAIGYVQIQEVGWYKYTQRVLGGETLS